MTAPAVAAARFCMAGAVGAGLGCFYGFLRPLRRKRHAIPDLIFVLAAFWGWLYVGFGICRGDLRMDWFFGMLLGGIGWECTVGRLLRPVFSGFWKGLGKLWKLLVWPFKKIIGFLAKNAKKVFAKCKKWVTIQWNNYCSKRKDRRCHLHGKQEKTTLSRL